ncbi:MAG: hypothetical protein AAFX09_00250 [Pseudomonadota bacterium]
MTSSLKPALVAITMVAAGLAAGTGAASAQSAGPASPAQSHAHDGPGGPGGHGMRRGRQGGGPGAALRMLQLADLNGDNTVTRAEIQQLRTEEFAYRDRNGDGFLDSEDRSPTSQRAMALREASDDRPRREARRVMRRMERMDANGDRRISQAEFVDAENRLFDRADANDDGAVTPSELDALVEQGRDRRENRRFWWRG